MRLMGRKFVEAFSPALNPIRHSAGLWKECVEGGRKSRAPTVKASIEVSVLLKECKEVEEGGSIVCEKGSRPLLRSAFS
jgi:hypothetical protein